MASGEKENYILPSLLDRLRDDSLQARADIRGLKPLSPEEQRACVLRDLETLFNTGNLNSVTELEQYPHVARSVLNYGVPCFAGRSLSAMGEAEFERLFRQAIIDFEPRILPQTLEVRVEIAGEAMNRTAVTLHIKGRLLTELDLALRTDVDLETGAVSLSDETRHNLPRKDSKHES